MYSGEWLNAGLRGVLSSDATSLRASPAARASQTQILHRVALLSRLAARGGAGVLIQTFCRSRCGPPAALQRLLADGFSSVRHSLGGVGLGIDIMYVSNVRSSLLAIAKAEFQINADELFPDAAWGASAAAGVDPEGAADQDDADEHRPPLCDESDHDDAWPGMPADCFGEGCRRRGR